MIQERLEKSLAKLEALREYEQGWDLGRGDKPSIIAIENAISLVKICSEHGVWKSSIFPSPSGAVLVAFPISDSLDIEVFLEADGLCDFRCEIKGKEDVVRPELSVQEACDLVNLYGNDFKNQCLSESLTSLSTTITSKNDIAVPHSNPQVTEGYQVFVPTALLTPQEVFATIFKSTTKMSQEVQPSIGSRILYQQTQPLYQRESRAIHAT